MRSWLTLAIVFLMYGCGDSNEGESPISIYENRNSAEQTNSRIESLENEFGYTELHNLDFQTTRRMERSLLEGSSLALAPTEDIVAIAKKAAHDLNPETQLQLLHLRRGFKNSYATFQQFHGEKPIRGAKLILKLLNGGDWKSYLSSLVNPILLKNIESGSRKIIDLKKIYPFRSIIEHEERIIMPFRNSMMRMEYLPVREILILDLEQNQRVWLWVRENSQEVLLRELSRLSSDSIKIVGSIFPKTPDDLPIEDYFSYFQVSGDRFRSLTDAKGELTLKNPPSSFDGVFENDLFRIERFPNTVATASVSINDNIGTIDDSLSSPEERNVFYWLNKAYLFNRQYLGFNEKMKKIVVVPEDTNEIDNAYFEISPGSGPGKLVFGTGKNFVKNPGLSREIIFHEYGHYLTYNIYGHVYSYEFKAMNEAFSDYFAAIYSGNPKMGEGLLIDPEEPYLRNLENDLKYPTSYLGNYPHSDGQMFSGALWDLRKKLGPDVADKMIQEVKLAQASTIREFILELLSLDEQLDDENPFTPSHHKKDILNAFFGHGLHLGVQFNHR